MKAGYNFFLFHSILDFVPSGPYHGDRFYGYLDFNQGGVKTQYIRLSKSIPMFERTATGLKVSLNGYSVSSFSKSFTLKGVEVKTQNKNSQIRQNKNPPKYLP